MSQQYILTDSCFWISLVDANDSHSPTAHTLYPDICKQKLIIPWPCMFETLDTRLARNKRAFIGFLDEIKKLDVMYLNDSDYQSKALREIETRNVKGGHSYSLVDCIIREIIKDDTIKLDYFITYNLKDFIDVCSIRGLDILPAI